MAYLHPMLQPYKPTAADPFDSVKAAHLLNRCTFGGTLQEIEKVRKMGPAAALDWLLDFPDAPAIEQSQGEDASPNFKSIQGYPADFRQYARMLAGKSAEEKKALLQQVQMANQQALRQLIVWWMDRMVHGASPFQEKLTFFWHGHFTTSAKDERAAKLMWDQNEILRQNAAGNFRTFVMQISRDPAMLDYLNNQQNRKEHPNENYARELMELFTLGIGNYTEYDVKQSARAFTGWGHDGESYIFRRYEHDDGIKTIFGQRGNFNGDDVIDMILAHPVCAPYIAGCFWKYFVSEDPDDAVVASLGAILRESNYDMRPMIRTLFASKAFYGPEAIGAIIKSPVQLVIGAARALEIPLPQMQLRGEFAQMGQVPMFPPNVKGWPGGRMWINTSTLFVRYNIACEMIGRRFVGGGGGFIGGNGNGNNGRGRFAGRHFNRGGGGGPQLPTDDARTPDQLVDDWVARLIQRPIDPGQRQVLLDSLGGSVSEEATRTMLELIVSMPEFQLC